MRPLTPCALLVSALAAALLGEAAEAQITRNPTGVNVNATGPTSVFLTFGNLGGKIPVEASWCGEIEAAAPAIGNRCVASTLYGRLPIRYDRAVFSGPALVPPAPVPPPPSAPPTDSLTVRAAPPPRPAAAPNALGSPLGALSDVMTIPASVARRAYQAAARGEGSQFYYVRRFVDPNGGPDEFVTITCRLTDGGARTPFSLLDVRVEFSTGDPALSTTLGAPVPPLGATIQYNGTGRLRGRWEIVRPGEALPDDDDLLTEATLPVEQRATQRRFTELSRFDVFLPPGGPFTLDGPPAARLPSDAPGMYVVLLRIEATDDREGNSDLGGTSAGTGVVASGGVAGFPMPPLRYYVGETEGVGTASDAFALVSPSDGATIPPTALTFRWTEHPHAAFTRIEIVDGRDELLSEAIVPRGATSYTAPPLIGPLAGAARWRAVALTESGRVMQRSVWRTLVAP